MYIKKLLNSCGFPSNLKGYDALSETIRMRHQYDYKRVVYKHLYQEIGPSIDSNPTCMERNMRTIINHVWYSYDHEKLLAIAYFPRKPEVKELVEAFVDYIVTNHLYNE